MTHEIGISFESTADPRAVRLLMTRDGRPWLRSFVRSSGPALHARGDALLCFGLLPAIELGCRLRIDAPVDRGLLASSAAVQRMVAGWTPGCRPVEVLAQPADSTYPADRGHGVFFSAGVDSSYSLAMNRDKLDGLVTVLGCDIDLADRERAAWLAENVRQVARAYHLEPIVLETDLPARMHPYLGWIEYHGSMLAGLRHLLADRFATMRVAASADEATMWDLPWGSHPGLDPRLGTAGATILLDGLVSRPEKIARVLDEPILLEHLRVCYHGGPNCGTCEKCQVTRICLDVLGGGRRAPSFPDETPPFDGRVLRIADTSVRNDRIVLRAAAVRAGGHDRLITAIDAAITEFDRRQPTLAERLQLKERLRVWRHRRRFTRSTLRATPRTRGLVVEPEAASVAEPAHQGLGRDGPMPIGPAAKHGRHDEESRGQGQ
jgi:hypothetical protein